MRQALGVLCAAALVPAALSPTASAATPPVNQGDRLIVGAGYCTVGYVDKAAGTVYTAAHCGEDGDRVGYITATGHVVENVGTLRPSPAFTYASAANDFATVEWDEGVTLGSNIITGDKRISAADVGEGDTICFNGSTSHGTTGGKACGAYRDKLGNNIYYFVSPGTRYGDSGGPVWVPGKGFLGVTSNTLSVEYDTENEDGVEIVTIPTEGPGFNNLVGSSVGAQALSSKDLSDDPFDPSKNQASSGWRLGEASSKLMDAGSSLDHAADKSPDEQGVIFAVLGIAAALGLGGALFAASGGAKHLPAQVQRWLEVYGP